MSTINKTVSSSSASSVQSSPIKSTQPDWSSNNNINNNETKLNDDENKTFVNDLQCDMIANNINTNNDLTNATVPIDQQNTELNHLSSVVPSSSTEHSINDSLTQTDDESSVIYHNNQSQEASVNQQEHQHQQQQQQQQHFSPIYTQEIQCNTSGVYDYSNSQVPVQQIQGSPYYVYQSPYSDYMNPMITNTPQQQTGILNSTNNYYTCGPYQAYVYDPQLGAYTLNTYSPMQTSQTTNSAQNPILSSPQQSSTILASYQTPRQAQNQLYITPSTISSPSCMSPNSETTTNTTTPNSSTTTSSSSSADPLTSNTNSPHQQQTPQTAYYQTSNPYLIYPTNPYLTPQAYQSPITGPTTYMMYQPTSTASAPYTPQQQTPNSIQSVPQNNNNNNNNNNRYNNRNRYNRNNNYNRRNNNRYGNSNMTSVESTPQFPVYTNQQTPTSGIYQSSSASPISCSTNNVESNNTVPQCDDGLSAYVDYNGSTATPSMCSPVGNPYEYCDPNQMINLQNYYDYVNAGITTYGDEFDEEEAENVDEENEQLACYVCRGRRMCFCYFLKVRYYKFPSFLDLVDHQYKKWRSNMIKAKKTTN